MSGIPDLVILRLKIIEMPSFNFFLVKRMMLYGYKTFRKSSEPGQNGPKKTKNLIFVILGQDESDSYGSFIGKMTD